MWRIPSVRRRCREHSRLCPIPGEQFPASVWSTRAGAPFPAAFQRLRPGTETDQDFLWDIFLIRNLNKKRQPWARCGDAPPSGRAPSLLQGSPGAGGRAGIPRNRCQPCASPPQPRSLALPPGILPHPGAPWPPPPHLSWPRGAARPPPPQGPVPVSPPARAAGWDAFRTGFRIPWLLQPLPLASVPSLCGKGQVGNILAGENTPGLLRRGRLGGRERGRCQTHPTPGKDFVSNLGVAKLGPASAKAGL